MILVPDFVLITAERYAISRNTHANTECAMVVKAAVEDLETASLQTLQADICKQLPYIHSPDFKAWSDALESIERELTARVVASFRENENE